LKLKNFFQSSKKRFLPTGLSKLMPLQDCSQSETQMHLCPVLQTLPTGTLLLLMPKKNLK